MTYDEVERRGAVAQQIPADDDPYRFKHLMIAEAIRRGADPDAAVAAARDIWQRYRAKPINVENVTALFSELILALHADRCPQCDHCRGEGVQRP